MTYKRLKSVTSGLLTGDTLLPRDPDELLGLLEMAFDEIVTHAEALRLLTLNKDSNVARLGSGNYLLRYPNLPETDEDELDLDNELGFPVARLLASYVSAKKQQLHYSEAKRLIRNYNSKIYEILETMQEQEDGTYDVKPTNHFE